jgi:hypothetical protein
MSNRSEPESSSPSRGFRPADRRKRLAPQTGTGSIVSGPAPETTGRIPRQVSAKWSVPPNRPASSCSSFSRPKVSARHRGTIARGPAAPARTNLSTDSQPGYFKLPQGEILSMILEIAQGYKRSSGSHTPNSFDTPESLQKFIVQKKFHEMFKEDPTLGRSNSRRMARAILSRV